MALSPEEVLQLLRYELNFIEQGGYRRLRESGAGSSPFKHSLVCLNYGDPIRPHACRDCGLFEFVPEEARTEDVPCNYIPLDDDGRTVASLRESATVEEMESALKRWLDKAIRELQGHGAARASTANK